MATRTKAALLFANGEIKAGPMLERVLRRAAAGEFARIIGVDGGARQARALGLRPQLIIGDMDSLPAAERAAFQAAGAELRQYPPEKDETDLELALRHCQSLGATRLTLLGAFGGRIDQTLANIFLLMLPSLDGLAISLVDGAQSLRLLRPGAHELLGAAGDTISLLALGEASGIQTRNLKYALRGDSLHFGPARGISNVMLAARAEISFTSGALLLVHTMGRA